jgi:DNA polymerase III subunit delta
MIYKSYIIEKNITILAENKSILFYGENIGLKKQFKTDLIDLNQKSSIIRLNQEEIINNSNIFRTEIDNLSLFDNKKILFVENCTDKILSILEKELEKDLNVQLFLFAEILDKKSKLRKYYENSKSFGVVACYADNEETLRKIIIDNLKNYTGLTPQNINAIIDSSSFDRVKLNNELTKIVTYFDNKKITSFELEKLLNINENNNFNLLKDEALIGNKFKTNKFLSDTIITSEKIILYLAIINQRLNKIYETLKNSKSVKIEESINLLKPPIFWKDKPIFIAQAKKWSLCKIKFVMKKTYDLEITIKSNSNINHNLLMKKLLIDICEIANA